MRKYMTDIATISKNCLMSYDQATLVLNMLEEHNEFSDIGIEIKHDFESLEPFPDSEEKVLVIFEIPRNIEMPVFFREFCKALNSESTVRVAKEK